MIAPARIEEELREQWVDATTAARFLGLDKSHLTAQLRAGKLPGAIQFGGARVWLIPRQAVEVYRGAHLDPDRYRVKRGPAGGDPVALRDTQPEATCAQCGKYGLVAGYGPGRAPLCDECL